MHDASITLTDDIDVVRVIAFGIRAPGIGILAEISQGFSLLCHLLDPSCVRASRQKYFYARGATISTVGLVNFW